MKNNHHTNSSKAESLQQIPLKELKQVTAKSNFQNVKNPMMTNDDEVMQEDELMNFPIERLKEIVVETFECKLTTMNPPIIPQPFTNLQLELLKLYSQKVSEEDLLAIKDLVAQYFAEKTMDLADEVWKKKGWTDADSKRMAGTDG